MMKKLAIIITVTILSISISAQDPHWNTDGNAGTTPGTNFMGTTDNQDLWFNTNNGFKMALTSPAGWLGLNIAAPDMMFHVDDGGILSTGTTGTNPDLDAGTRLMWIPDQFAFRAGRVDDDQWDGVNVGNGSVAFGEDNIASGTRSVAFGINNEVTGNNSVAFADGNEVTGINSLAFGASNTIVAANGIGLGTSNAINNTGGVAIGARNTINGDFGVTIGRFLEAQDENAIVLGRGIDANDLLLNDIENSLMVGFNSTLSTFYVGPPEGEEEYGSVGIGDVTEPTERLDVRGTARFRVMEEAETPDVVITGMEFDEEEGDYVLHYSSLEDVGDCTWDKVNSDNDLATGYTDACVEGHVLIGTDQPLTGYKVYMINTDQPRTLAVQSIGSETQQYGALFSAEGGTTISGAIIALANDSPNNVGVSASASGSQSGYNQGVRGTASGGSFWDRGLVGVGNRGSNLNYGVYGEAYKAGESDPRQQVGVYGSAYNYSIFDNFGGYFYACDSENNIGVYATVCGETGGVAGYFTGAVLDTQSPISLSDETIKTQISEMENPLEIINQLQPVQYYFNTSEFPHLHLKSTKSYGFSAQQVQELLPEVVQEVHHPAQFDTLGEMISPPEDLLGIRYQEFIAILTAGIKEQQSTIDSLEQAVAEQATALEDVMDLLDMMQDQIDNCCMGGQGFKNQMQDGVPGENLDKGLQYGNVLNQNSPNPFRSQTTISYTLEQGGKALLNIFDKTGKPITTLVEAEQQAGNYRYEWDASGLPAGLYHYALYVDGELLVKKAIKLQD